MVGLDTVCWWKICSNVECAEDEVKHHCGCRHIQWRGKCPKIRIGHRYVLLGEDDTNNNRQGFVVNGKTVLYEWNEDAMDKVLRFAKREKLGHCSVTRRY
ncbi:hypothetical protein KIN20_035636 [Parelaphostrongylus tenuis]|uniref:Netrin module non-TIMP type domain-containing protein n=1 Tax=Parelaphostrongylus tenuis TaxID=148309 RepID=A0AAD5RBI7_PARTN|nr:hypothetical protein KIN20_035636 [Parelaphostrongylus tenuis]